MRNSCSLGIKAGVLRTRHDICIGNATQSSSYHHRLCVCMMTLENWILAYLCAWIKVELNTASTLVLNSPFGFIAKSLVSSGSHRKCSCACKGRREL